MSLYDDPTMGKYASRVLLAGCARSGTTWLAQALNYLDEFRIVFEPLHSDNVDLVRHFRRHQYLRTDTHNEEFYEPLRKILAGTIAGPWVDLIKSSSKHRKLLVKDIFCSLLLQYIRVNFPDVRIIYLLRHPCAVAQSRLATHMSTNTDCLIKGLTSQHELMEDYLEPFSPLLARQDWTEYQRNILLWCVLNYVGLRQIANDQVCIVFYEHLWLRPESEIPRINAYLGESFYLPAILEVMRQPSRTTRRNSPVRSGGNPIWDWQESVSDDQVAFAYDMLREFGLGMLYDRDPFPVCDPGDPARPGNIQSPTTSV